LGLFPELLLGNSQLFSNLGIKLPQGIFMDGPPGWRKTLIARAIANQTGANFDIINGPEALSKMSGQSEGNLWQLFEDAQSKPPGIFFIDELDSIAPNREKTHGEAKHHVVSQMLTLRMASRADRTPSSSRPLTIPIASTSHSGTLGDLTVRLILMRISGRRRKGGRGVKILNL
jgi:transitional endoplasmic reticulum ATPase